MKAGTKISTPCDRNCGLGADGICVSCLRTCTEITEWTRYSDEQRKQIMESLNARALKPAPTF